MEDISKKIEFLREDEDTKEIFDFLISLPKLDFQLYGQFFMDIYKCKVQDGSGTSKIIIDNEKKKIMTQVHEQITKDKLKIETLENEKLSLEEKVKEAKHLEEKAKRDLQCEQALRETKMAGKIHTAVVEKEKEMKKEADIQAEKYSSLKSELDKEKAQKDIEIQKAMMEKEKKVKEEADIQAEKYSSLKSELDKEKAQKAIEIQTAMMEKEKVMKKEADIQAGKYSSLKSELDKEKAQKDIEIQTAMIEKEQIMKKEADIQAGKYSSLKNELDKEKAQRDIEIMRKTKKEIDENENNWKTKVSEKKNTIVELQTKQDLLQNKLEEYHEKSNKSHEILAKLGGIEKAIIKPVNSSRIGQKGEEYVLQALKTAFPNNSKIFNTKQNQCGDIVFNIENTSKWIMFEVKDVETSNIKNHKQGNDLEKFYEDSKTNKLGYKLDAAVLVSLNCIVDPTITNLEPFVKDGKPYMYVDNARTENSDPISLFRAIVGMMKFMIDHCMDNKVENFGVKIQKYMEQTRMMYKLYDNMMKNHKASGKNLEKMKESLDGHFKDLETDNAKNEGGLKRTNTDAVESPSKYFKTEHGLSSS